MWVTCDLQRYSTYAFNYKDVGVPWSRMIVYEHNHTQYMIVLYTPEKIIDLMYIILIYLSRKTLKSLKGPLENMFNHLISPSFIMPSFSLDIADPLLTYNVF